MLQNSGKKIVWYTLYEEQYNNWCDSAHWRKFWRAKSPQTLLNFKKDKNTSLMKIYKIYYLQNLSR